MTVLDGGTAVELANVNPQGADRAESLHNGGFAWQPVQWFPVSKVHRLPGHIDMLYLEIFIERDLTGLAFFS